MSRARVMERARSAARRGTATRRQFGEFLDRQRLSVHAGAAMLASIAAGAHLVEQVPDALAPSCAAIAAMMAGLSWAAQSSSRDNALAREDRIPTETMGEIALPSAGTAPCARLQSSYPESGRGQARLAIDHAQAAALADLTARISHDLRTPLNAVIGFAELMSNETFGPLGSQRYQSYAEHIRECGKTLLKSTEDTLAITSALAQPAEEHSGAGLVTVCLSHILDDAWECVSLQALQQAVSLERSIPQGAELFGDRRLLRQILVNLLQEAIGRAARGARIGVRAEVAAGGVRLAVETHGCQADAQEDSLSLCVARALIELHGLRIETVSNGRQGWQAAILLERSVQTDFFPSQPTSRPPSPIKGSSMTLSSWRAPSASVSPGFQAARP